MDDLLLSFTWIFFCPERQLFSSFFPGDNSNTFLMVSSLLNISNMLSRLQTYTIECCGAASKAYDDKIVLSGSSHLFKEGIKIMQFVFYKPVGKMNHSVILFTISSLTYLLKHFLNLFILRRDICGALRN